MTPGRMEVRHKGHRYWGHLTVCRGGCIWRFYSDHPWPFHRGHFTQRRLDRREAMEKFRQWLPFEATA